MLRSEQTTAMWHGLETLEPREYAKTVRPTSRRYTIKQGDHWDWLSFRFYGRHDLYYLILDANKGDPTVIPAMGQEIVIPALS